MSNREELQRLLREGHGATNKARDIALEAASRALELSAEERAQVLRAIAIARTKIDEAEMCLGYAAGMMRR